MAAAPLFDFTNLIITTNHPLILFTLLNYVPEQEQSDVSFAFEQAMMGKQKNRAIRYIYFINGKRRRI